MPKDVYKRFINLLLLLKCYVSLNASDCKIFNSRLSNRRATIEAYFLPNVGRRQISL